MCIVTGIIIQSKFLYLSIGREPITRPAHAQFRPNVFAPKYLFYSCINETTLFSFLQLLLHENGRSLCFPWIFMKKQTRWSNDKIVIEVCYHKILWFVTVSQISYLPQSSASANNNWSACHWQIKVFCSTLLLLKYLYPSLPCPAPHQPPSPPPTILLHVVESNLYYGVT